MSSLSVQQELLAWVQDHEIVNEVGVMPDGEAYESLMAILEPLRVELEHLRLATQENGFRSIFEALDDLWGCIGKPEISHLEEETVAIAKANHHALHHSE